MYAKRRTQRSGPGKNNTVKITPVYKNKETKKYAMGGKFTSRRVPSRKRGIAPMIIGAGIGAATNIVGSIIANKKAKKEKVEAENMAMRNMLQQEQQMDEQQLEGANLNGIDGVEYYAKGGNIQSSFNGKSAGGYETEGGALVPIGEGVEKAVGNKHAENNIDGTYGIKVKENGEPIAEIEDGEVVADGNVVFSDQMLYDKTHTYADKMEQLTKKRNKLEKELDGKTKKRDRNTIERQLASLNMAEDTLFQDQELAKLVEGQKELGKGNFDPEEIAQIKTNLEADGVDTSQRASLPVMADGGNFGKVATQVAPKLIDNVVNMALTANQPKLSAPLLAKTRRMKTNINVNPQLAAVRSNTEATASNAYNNSSNSNSARNGIARARLAGERREGEILANKENIETQLENQNRSNAQRVSNANVGLVNRNKEQQFTRANDIQSQISANFSDLSDDITSSMNYVDKGNRDDERMILDVMNDKTGAKARSYENNPFIQERLKNDPKFKAMFEELLKGTSTTKDQRSSGSFNNKYAKRR